MAKTFSCYQMLARKSIFAMLGKRKYLQGTTLLDIGTKNTFKDTITQHISYPTSSRARAEVVQRPLLHVGTPFSAPTSMTAPLL